VLGKDGKLLPNATGTTLGQNWLGEDPVVSMREGNEPRADNEHAQRCARMSHVRELSPLSVMAVDCNLRTSSGKTSRSRSI